MNHLDERLLRLRIQGAFLFIGLLLMETTILTAVFYVFSWLFSWLFHIPTIPFGWCVEIAFILALIQGWNQYRKARKVL